MRLDSLRVADEEQLDERPAEERQQQGDRDDGHDRKGHRITLGGQRSLRREPGQHPTARDLQTSRRRLRRPGRQHATTGLGEKLVLVAGDDHVDHASGMGKIVECPCLNALDILRRDEPGEMHHLQRRRAGLEDDATVRSRDDQRVEGPVIHVIAQQRFDQIVQAQPHLPGALGVGELIPQNPRHLGVAFHELQRHLGVAGRGRALALCSGHFTISADPMNGMNLEASALTVRSDSAPKRMFDSTV